MINSRFSVEKFRAILSLFIARYKKNWYLPAIALDILILFFLILLTGNATKTFISPFPKGFHSSQLQSSYKKTNLKKFSFAPGWTVRKLDMVNFQNLDTLAFFDVPIDDDGTLIRDTQGYQMFVSPKAQELFHTAHAHGTKVTMTITHVDNMLIQQLLDNEKMQRTLIAETIQEVSDAAIDGVTVDFEFTGDTSENYRNKFTDFVSAFKQHMQKKLPDSIVTVAIPDKIGHDSLYDTRALSQVSDQIFLMAYNFAVPEIKNGIQAAPVYGYHANDYLQKVSSAEEDFLQYIPSEKLAVETAWYGNGDLYPLYLSDENIDRSKTKNTLHTPISKKVTERLISEVPLSARASVRKNLPLIAKALEDEGILNENVLAYALATIEHETAGTFEPIDEFKGRKSARRLGYEGGTNYFGRGFIQLTHLRNYKRIGQRIGLGDELVKNPSLASDPSVAAKVLAAFFKDNGIARLATGGNFIAARQPINPDYQGGWIASLAYKFLYVLV